ncbi:MAG: hypothetical protein F6J90_32315 [Moorea sp. SIOASIH]|nr:hypothetical protein [Moorena sp. SIOASIH]
MTYSHTDSLSSVWASCQLHPSVRIQGRRPRGARTASFINDTGCPDPPEQYKKKVRF